MRYLYIKTRSVSHNILLVLLLLIVTAFMTVAGLLDPKEVRKMKAKGGHTMAESALDGESRNNKKQSIL